MAEFTATAINIILDWLDGVASAPAAATRYLTVFNGDPTSGGTEVINTLNGSANRIDLTTAMAAASSGSAANDTLITIVSSAVTGATVDYCAIYTAITGGTLYAYTPVASKTLTAGDSLTVPVGNLTLAIV